MSTNLEVRRLLEMILERPVGNDENPSRTSEADWDSLKHAELVFLLEDHFGARFNEQDLRQMNDVQEIAQTVENRLKSS